ncbi:2-dehydropantoate 2-reductase [Aspergillus heteromorphus CBS 117.55]|uniref:2-dehydropantoate 2-reductase n=1 Tax=Aspergillus heteromorphus CBS 117.55 TaxID=1448321 RepID=A0A317WEC2_9EURO|nr:2-dehydropantoate 2-reductase [Aspergillus heteromorphus CBS 117.55]PWY84774.1 2-dehydropantoate 2-reductase [Aspergillus heteromorphus CBS 117.55]
MNAHGIHVIGLGSIGTVVAHSLRCIPTPPPVTLLLHREAIYQQFLARGQRLHLQVGEGGSSVGSAGYDVDFVGDANNSHRRSAAAPIRSLIVAVKACATVSALRPIQHRLGRQSTICLFQNGLGQIEALNKHLFPDPLTRPTYMFGIMRHSAYIKSPLDAVLAGRHGSGAIGVVGDQVSAEASPHCRDLIDRLVAAPIIRCTEMPWIELRQAQLLKLSTNCMVNPLTALLGVHNGAMLENAELRRMQRPLLGEISSVFCQLPELQGLPDVQARMSVAALEEQLISNIQKTAGNSSSMCEDVRAGRATEIEFINGWVVRQGQEMGIACPINRCLVQLILARSRLQ